jgi:hypothetical protein
VSRLQRLNPGSSPSGTSTISTSYSETGATELRRNSDVALDHRLDLSQTRTDEMPFGGHHLWCLDFQNRLTFENAPWEVQHSAEGYHAIQGERTHT